MIIYAREGDNLDEICYRVFGNTDHIETVVNANPQAIGKAILPIGMPITLPDRKPVQVVKKGVKLWD